MMNKLKNFFQKVLNFRKGDKGYAIYPNRDWTVAFFALVFLNLILIVILVIAYFDVKEDNGFALDTLAEERVLFDRELFDTRMEEYQEKSDRLNTLSSESPQFIDPSI